VAQQGRRIMVCFHGATNEDPSNSRVRFRKPVRHCTDLIIVAVHSGARACVRHHDDSRHFDFVASSAFHNDEGHQSSRKSIQRTTHMLKTAYKVDPAAMTSPVF
jgi:hypothetical protein